MLQGSRSNAEYESAKSYLSVVDLHQMGGYQVAVQSVLNYRILRKKGWTVRKAIEGQSLNSE